MIHAYDKVYLDKARTALGRMLDFAVYDLNYDIENFFNLFLSSGFAKRFEEGDFLLLAGMSGVELAYEVLAASGKNEERIKPVYSIDRSEEYWTGWALAYYQWETGLRFESIIEHISIKEIQALYSPYHEMDIRQFVDKMNELYKLSKPETNLKIQRKKAGLNQRELSELSGVPLRTIQQYEQQQKNINKAQVESLIALSKALCCSIDDLIEHME